MQAFGREEPVLSSCSQTKLDLDVVHGFMLVFNIRKYVAIEYCHKTLRINFYL